MNNCWPLLAVALAGGCLEEPTFNCESDAVCIWEGHQGTCDRASARCVYPSATCQQRNALTPYVDSDHQCVPAPANASEQPPDAGSNSTGPSPVAESSTGRTADESTTAEPDDPSETTVSSSDDESTTSPVEEMTTDAGGCEVQAYDITAQGTATASSVFRGFPIELGVDGASNTSWFSTGPEGGGGPSIYAWSTVTDRCITAVEIDDNSLHSQPQFRTGFGFGSMTIRILQDDQVVFEQDIALPGAPDGPVEVDTGGIVGSRVVLELKEHEDDECGGFSELRILGASL